MLRRRPDNTFEFREIERMLYSVQPPALAPERRDALRVRIMASLGQQDAPRSAALPLLPPFRERWVAIPAGVGLAAAVIAGMKYYEGTLQDGDVYARISGPVTVDGAYAERAEAGDLLVAVNAADIDIGTQFRISLEAGARFSYYESDGQFTFRPHAGTATLVTGNRDAFLIGDGWSGRIASGSLAQFTASAEALTVHVLDGMVWLKVGNEPELRLAKGLPAMTLVLGGSGSVTEQDVFPPAWNRPAAGGAVDGLNAPGTVVPPGSAGSSAATPASPASPAAVVPPAVAEPPAGPVTQVPPAHPPVNPPTDSKGETGTGPAEAAAPPFAEDGAFEEGNPAGIIPPTAPGEGAVEPPGSSVNPPAHGQGGEPGSSGNGGSNQGNGNGPGANSSGGANNGNGPGSNSGNGSQNSNNGNGGGNDSGHASAANGHPGNGNGQGSPVAKGLDRIVLASVAGDPEAAGVQSDAAEETVTHPGNSDPRGNAFGHEKEDSGKSNNGVGPGETPGKAKGKNA
jgi:hypothetical protein